MTSLESVVRSNATQCDLLRVTEIGEGVVSDAGAGASIRGQAESVTRWMDRVDATFRLARSRWRRAGIVILNHNFNDDVDVYHDLPRYHGPYSIFHP